MAAITFQKYLKQKLKELQLDESVYTEYITSILEDETSDDEKRETLQEVLSGVLETNVESVTIEIFAKFIEFHPKDDKPEEKPPEVDVEDRLVKLLETQKLATNEVRVYSEEERRIREQILAQYSQLSGDEEDDEEAVGSSENLDKNTNFTDVQARMREQRENAKLASEAKKLKDKEDREKQKQLKEEKKEKRKTVKGERKR